MNEDHGRAFVSRHIAALQAELDRMRKVLADIDDGAVRHLDAGKFRADVTESISAYERSIAMWVADISKMD